MPTPTKYAWLTLAQARTLLLQRLADPSGSFWGAAECNAYIVEALRTWNSLTSMWLTEYEFNPPVNPGDVWYSLSALVGSPRPRTVTDVDLYTVLEYHLLEPATGGTWTGTPQFSISDLSGALQRKRDELLQLSGCNLTQLVTPYQSNIRRTFLPDSTLEVLRARQVPVQGDPVTLWRGDGLSFEYFDTGYLQKLRPQAYDVISVPPLAIDVDRAFNVPGNLDLIVLQSGAPFNPPTPIPVGLPDDWTWVAKWGALGDLLSRESEATDLQRASYALQRYVDGIRLMQKMPWIMLGNVDKIPVDTVSVVEMDTYAAEWDTGNSGKQAIVTAGIDYFAISPIPSSKIGVVLTVLANAPVPILDGDFVQVSRDSIDSILDYAQHLAAFKQGGQEFMETKVLAARFIRAATDCNKRLDDLGLFRDILLTEGQRQFETQERFQGQKQ